jgi:hypothetical protein
VTTAFVGLLLGVLVVSAVGIWSARIASNEAKAKAKIQAERTQQASGYTARRSGPNEDNPNAMAMATGTQTNKPDSESSPYSGS